MTSAPYRSAERDRNIARNLADPEILARVLYFEMRRGFVAVVAAHVLGAVVVGFLGVTYSGRWWPNVLVALITGRLAWWSVNAKRNLGVASHDQRGGGGQGRGAVGGDEATKRGGG